jgi:hypothetical protein
VTEQAKKDARELWLPVGVVVTIGCFLFYIGSAWASNNGELKSQDQRITKLEIAVQGIALTLDQVKESNISLKVGMDNLANRVYEVGKDVKDIRTAVK